MQKIFNQLIDTHPEIKYKYFTPSIPTLWNYLVPLLALLACFFILQGLKKNGKIEKVCESQKIKYRKTAHIFFAFGISTLLLAISIGIFNVFNKKPITTSEQIYKLLEEELHIKKGSSKLNKVYYISINAITPGDKIYLKENTTDSNHTDPKLIEFDTKTKEIKPLTLNGEVLLKEYNKLFEETQKNGEIEMLEFKKDSSQFPTISFKQNNKVKSIIFKDTKIIVQ